MKKIFFIFLLPIFCIISCKIYFAENFITEEKNVPNNLDISKDLFLENTSNNTTNNTLQNISNNNKAKKKFAALTFDDGPNIKYTKQILKILKGNNIKATFFFVGKNAKIHPEIVKEAFQDGHIIANHTYSHPHLKNLSKQEIETELVKAREELKEIIGVYPILFRPPYGEICKKLKQITNKLKLKTIMWDTSTNDYVVYNNNSEKISSTIIKFTHPGYIITLHDGGGNRKNTVEALPIIIDVLKKNGYEFLTIPEILVFKNKIPQSRNNKIKRHFLKNQLEKIG